MRPLGARVGKAAGACGLPFGCYVTPGIEEFLIRRSKFVNPNGFRSFGCV